MKNYICIHGHFYQTPRENPWLEEIELDDTAYPYHDWNERILTECYAPNARSRIQNDDGYIIDIVNNYSRMSFNFGPTLLSWIEKNNEDVYKEIISGDKLSQERYSGHGVAIAQMYHHAISPLLNSEDKKTQIIWGIQDFIYHFKREPEGMWLPEMAVDLETLDLMAIQGIKFTILSPGQIECFKNKKDGEWISCQDNPIDINFPYFVSLPSGKQMGIFLYNTEISEKVAFSGLLNNGEQFARHLIEQFSIKKDERPRIIHMATDGETYGHFHKSGDMALSYCLHKIEQDETVELTCYGEFLEKYPPEYELKIIENSSWSCPHGVSRWNSNCGCKESKNTDWNQDWKTPYKAAIGWLRDNLIQIYRDKGNHLLNDIENARNNYIHVILNKHRDSQEDFIRNNCHKSLENNEKILIFKLMEMQKNSLAMYTSSGYYFDEISCTESKQVLLYAARAIQLANDISSISLEEAFMDLLDKAKSNIDDIGTGKVIYENYIRPSVIDLIRLGVHFVASSLFKEDLSHEELFQYRVKTYDYKYLTSGKHKLSSGQLRLLSKQTLEEMSLSFAFIYFGDYNFMCGTREFIGNENFSIIQEELEEKFNLGQFSEVIRLIGDNFEQRGPTLWQLFKDEQRRIINSLLIDYHNSIEDSFTKIYRDYYSLMQISKGMVTPIPESFRIILNFIINKDLSNLLTEEEFDSDQLSDLFQEIDKWDINFDKTFIEYLANNRLDQLTLKWSNNPLDTKILKQLQSFLNPIIENKINLNLWKIQNIFFSIGQNHFYSMKKKYDNGDKKAYYWLRIFESLSQFLKVKINENYS